MYQYVLYQVIENKQMFAFCGEHLFYYETDKYFDKAIQLAKPNIYLLNYSEIETNLAETIAFAGLRERLTTLYSDEFFRLSRALQILHWQDCHQFCSRCGTKTIFTTFEHTGELLADCPTCHYHQYPRINPCTITAITREHLGKRQILLAHHHRAKSSKVYTLIAGFVEIGETLENCVKREVLEEVGLTVENIRYVASQPWAFPSNLMVGFVADFVSGEIVIDKNELVDAQFFDIDDLPKIPEKGTIAYDLIMFVKEQDIFGKISSTKNVY